MPQKKKDYLLEVRFEEVDEKQGKAIFDLHHKDLLETTLKRLSMGFIGQTTIVADGYMLLCSDRKQAERWGHDLKTSFDFTIMVMPQECETAKTVMCNITEQLKEHGGQLKVMQE